MIDFIILLQSHPYAVVGQHHPGWVGMLQDHLLGALNCVWFNRGACVRGDGVRIETDRLEVTEFDD
jgi:hypothetical protein